MHISNGHIIYAECTPNPGLDLYMLGISYVISSTFLEVAQIETNNVKLRCIEDV